ncbi:hypothetical protein ACX12E_11265 [Paenibacillus vandeheii]|uniref:hypothetical protein n=1 Tax=Paenibacillus vandeheii TaxID=3035917 RepID=UPI003F4D8962
MSEVKPNSPNGQGHVYGYMGGYEHMQGYMGHEMHGYGYGYGTMPMGYGYGYAHNANHAPMLHGCHQGCGTSYGHAGGSWGSMGTILVLFILLVIISKTMFI